MVTVVVATEETPKESVAVALIVYVPAAMYWCGADGPFMVVPSPKSINVEVMVESEAAEAFKVAVTVTGAVPELGDAVTLTVGGI